MHIAQQLRWNYLTVRFDSFSQLTAVTHDATSETIFPSIAKMAVGSVPLSILALIFSGLALVLSPTFNRWLTRSLLAWRYGCKEPPRPNINLDEINRTSAENYTFLDTTTRLFKEHGKTYKTKRGGRVFIRTCDPEVSKAVLSTHFEKFGLQPIRYEGGKSFFGNGMLVTDGAQWRTSRALIRPTFDVAHIANLDRLGPFVDRFMRLLPRDGSTVDLFPLLKRLVSLVKAMLPIMF